MITKDFIEKAKAEVNIHQVVSDRVGDGTSTRGARMNACCPFHNGSSKSLDVRSDQGSYKCWSCDAHGDAINFIMEFDDVPFHAALETLVEDYTGLEMPKPEKKKPDEVDPETRKIMGMTKAMNKLQNMYAMELVTNSRAISYAKLRGITPETAALFQIGYGSTGLKPSYEQAGLTKEDLGHLVDMEVLRKNDDGSYWSMFSKRLIFPIKNSHGDCIGLSGRYVGETPDDIPKYVNSINSLIFDKSEALFGLYESRVAAGGGLDKNGKQKLAFKFPVIYVTEGQLDPLKIIQTEIGAAAAISGSAITDAQMSKLLRFSDHLCFVFDGDSAGYKAAKVAAKLSCKHVSTEKRFTFLPLQDGHDPDSVLSSAEGIDWFKSEAANPVSLAAMVARICADAGKEGNDNTSRRALIMKESSEWLKTIENEHFRSSLQIQMAAAFKVPVASLTTQTENAAAEIQSYESAVRNDPMIAMLHLGAHCPRAHKALTAIVMEMDKNGTLCEEWLKTLAENEWNYAANAGKKEFSSLSWSPHAVLESCPYGAEVSVDDIAPVILRNLKKRLGILVEDNGSTNSQPIQPAAVPQVAQATQPETPPQSGDKSILSSQSIPGIEFPSPFG